jgi:hypothetical protein
MYNKYDLRDCDMSYNGGESNGCPICQRMIPGGNVGLNQHIDECLNHSTIQEMNSLPPIRYIHVK